MYDPRLARFLSPDPYVQAPGYTQSFNRYSYVWNNPLKYTDPSGYQVNDPNNGKVVYKGYTFYFWEISAYEHAIRMEVTNPVSAGVLALITSGSPNSYYSGLKNIGGGFYENSQGEIISASGVVFYLNGLDPSGKYVVGKNGEVGYYVNVDFHEVWGVGSMVEGNYKEARRYHRYSHSERVWVGLGKKNNNSTNQVNHGPYFAWNHADGVVLNGIVLEGPHGYGGIFGMGPDAEIIPVLKLIASANPIFSLGNGIHIFTTGKDIYGDNQSQFIYGPISIVSGLIPFTTGQYSVQTMLNNLIFDKIIENASKPKP
jgi:hypothetical protein